MNTLTKTLENAIQDYVSSPNNMMYQELVVALLMAAKSHEVVRIPVTEANPETHTVGYYILADEAGKAYLSLMTKEAVNPGIETREGTVTSLVRALQQYSQLEGICLNPWNQPVFIPRDQIDYILSQMR